MNYEWNRSITIASETCLQRLLTATQYLNNTIFRHY